MTDFFYLTENYSNHIYIHKYIYVYHIIVPIIANLQNSTLWVVVIFDLWLTKAFLENITGMNSLPQNYPNLTIYTCFWSLLQKLHETFVLHTNYHNYNNNNFTNIAAIQNVGVLKQIWLYEIIGVCYWYVKILQCGYMGHGLKLITSKHIATLEKWHNRPLVRDKPHLWNWSIKSSGSLNESDIVTNSTGDTFKHVV